jgi:hypothetical protein
MMILNILWDLPLSQNQPLKSSDDQYIRIFKNVVKTSGVLDEIKKTKKIRHWFKVGELGIEHVVIFVYM